MEVVVLLVKGGRLLFEKGTAEDSLQAVGGELCLPNVLAGTKEDPRT